jgi:hypothetical protein
MRRSDRALTLVEILLSILVLMIGVLGILSLFPTAMQTGRETADERHAINLAESVKHAVSTGIRFRITDPADPNFGKVLVLHDMDGGSGFPYLYKLPQLQDGWRRHPPAGAADALGDGPPAPNSETSPQFFVSSDGWINATVDDVRANDPTDPYRRFAFNFDVFKPNSLAHLLGTPKPGGGVYALDDLDAQLRLFEVRIHVHRIKGGPLAGNGPGNSVAKNLVLTVTHRVSRK